MEGLTEDVDMDELFHLPKEFWEQEVSEIRQYFKTQVPQDLPPAIEDELRQLEERVKSNL